MCLLVVAVGLCRRFPVIILNNRDEFVDRPTAPLLCRRHEAPLQASGLARRRRSTVEEHSDGDGRLEIACCEDLSPEAVRADGDRGTWMALRSDGEFAALTNSRQKSFVLPQRGADPRQRRSRGELVYRYLIRAPSFNVTGDPSYVSAAASASPQPQRVTTTTTPMMLIDTLIADEASYYYDGYNLVAGNLFQLASAAMEESGAADDEPPTLHYWSNRYHRDPVRGAPLALKRCVQRTGWEEEEPPSLRCDPWWLCLGNTFAQNAEEVRVSYVARALQSIALDPTHSSTVADAPVADVAALFASALCQRPSLLENGLLPRGLLAMAAGSSHESLPDLLMSRGSSASNGVESGGEQPPLSAAEMIEGRLQSNPYTILEGEDGCSSGFQTRTQSVVLLEGAANHMVAHYLVRNTRSPTDHDAFTAISFARDRRGIISS